MLSRGKYGLKNAQNQQKNQRLNAGQFLKNCLRAFIVTRYFCAQQVDQLAQISPLKSARFIVSVCTLEKRTIVSLLIKLPD